MMTQAALAGARAGAIQPTGVCDAEELDPSTGACQIVPTIREAVRTFISQSNEDPSNFEVNIQPITMTLPDSSTISALQVEVARPRAGFLWLPRLLSLCEKNIVRLVSGNSCPDGYSSCLSFSEGTGMTC